MALPINGIASAKLKLVRIAKHLNEINSIIGELAKSTDTYEIIKDTNGKDTVHFLVDAPTDIQIIAGEIIYQFRSALDHLAFQLVESNPKRIKLPKGWERDCQFPILLTVPTCGKPPIEYPVPVPYGFFENKLPGISMAAYAFIESAQPYHSGKGVHNILRIIGKLSNIDKHRHLYVLLPRISVQDDVTYSDGMRGTSILGGLKHGAEIPLPDEFPGQSPMNMKRSFTPYITFDKTIGEGPDTVETENLLEVCLEQFKTVIIPAFEKLIQ
jgi:hypothetical protein